MAEENGQTRPSSKLVSLKKERFRSETRAERMKKSLAALYQGTSIKLSAEEWKRIAEDTDIEDQF